MTRPIPFISILMLLAAFAAATLVVLPHPAINISLPAQSSAVEVELEDYVLDVRHTDPSHFPNHAGTKANVMIAALTATWQELLMGQGPDPKIRCGAIMDAAGAPFRVAIWVADVVNKTQGFLAVFNPSGGWVTGYDRDLAGFERGPDPNKLRQGQYWDANFPCPTDLPQLVTN